MKSSYSTYFLGLALVALSACWNVKNDEEPIARAYEDFLYLSDIRQDIERRPFGVDSVQFVNALIKDWLKTQALVHRAHLNLPVEKQNFKRLVEDYENSLYIYAYEKEIVSEKLVTEVKFEEIDEFYRQNIHEFVLDEPAIRLNYAVFDSVGFRLTEVRKLFNRDSEEAKEELLDYCSRYAKEYALDDSLSWVFSKNISDILPIEERDLKWIVGNRWAKHQYADGKAYIFRYAKERKKGERAPLALVQKTIKERILVKKRRELLNQLGFDLFNEGLNNKDLEIITKHD